MTDRRVKECIIFNPETGISEDGTMHDGVYRPRTHQPKKERKMTREEAIYILRNLRAMTIRDNYIKPNSGWDFNLGKIIDLLQEKPTLAEFLGWEEGQEYVIASGGVYKIEGDELLLKFRGRFGESTMKVSDMKLLRQAKKVDTMGIKDSLLDELQELVTSKRINEIIEQLRGLNND